jgi:hypothetical protein
MTTATRGSTSESPSGTARDLGVIALGFAGALAVFLAAGGIREWSAAWPAPNHHQRDPLLILTTFSGTFALAVVVLRLAYGRGRSLTGQSAQVLQGVIFAGPVAFFLWKVTWSEAWGGLRRMFSHEVESAIWSMSDYDEPAWGAINSPYGFKCLGLSTVMAAAILAALVTTRRGTQPLNPRIAGAALGVASAIAAAALTDLWCPIGNPLHVLVGHVLPMVILGVVGAGPGAWLLGKPSSAG